MFTIIGGDGKEYGPASVSQIRAWMAAGRASLETQAKAQGSEEWRRLGDFSEFAIAEEPPVMVSEVRSDDLAGRGARLGAWFIDNIFATICCLPGVLIVGAAVAASLLAGDMNMKATMTPQNAMGWLVLSAGALVVFVVQVTMLTTRGQTVGKWLLNIRIVRLVDGGNPGFVSTVLLRAIVPSLIAMLLNVIPGLGVLFTLVDCGLIFRDDRRCIHDFIAGTKVVAVKRAVAA